MIEVLDYLPNVLQAKEVIDLPVDGETTQAVSLLMTPNEILSMQDFPPPQVITPSLYPDFDSLSARREDIRCLRLLPIKSEQEYHRYHGIPKEVIDGFIAEYLKDSDLTLAINRFPYWLPEDLGQYIVWAGDPAIPNLVIAEFMARAMYLARISLDEVILFERPKNITQKLVKGTFPKVRHIHFWIKIGDLTKIIS